MNEGRVHTGHVMRGASSRGLEVDWSSNGSGQSWEVARSRTSRPGGHNRGTRIEPRVPDLGLSWRLSLKR